jgi:Tfp pilus assembly protein FimT
VRPDRDRGVALADVLVALALTALVSATTIPVVAGVMERERTTLGAQFVAARVAHAQLEALRRGVAVALRFEVGAEDTAIRMFADGNGNGVLRSEIDAGIDQPVGPLEHLGVHAQGVSLRINQRVPDPGGTGWLEAGSDALRIGSTTLVSCAPMGSLTSGTLYVASRGGPQMAIRLTGSTGRVRVLRFEPARAAWLP